MDTTRKRAQRGEQRVVVFLCLFNSCGCCNNEIISKFNFFIIYKIFKQREKLEREKKEAEERRMEEERKAALQLELQREEEKLQEEKALKGVLKEQISELKNREAEV